MYISRLDTFVRRLPIKTVGIRLDKIWPNVIISCGEFSIFSKVNL